MYRSFIHQRTGNPPAVYFGLLNGVNEHKTLEESMRGAEAIVSNPNYNNYLAVGYDVFIVDLDKLEIVATASKPLQPLLDWVRK